jgi:hypothetical protein
MSTIKVDNIRIASESVSRPATGVAAAYATPNSSGELTWESLNVTSSSDEGDGIIGIKFTSPMLRNNYSTTMTVVTTTAKFASSSNATPDDTKIYVWNNAGSAANARATLQIFGELA